MDVSINTPKHDVSDITNNFMTLLLDKLSNENKEIMIMGDFNIKLSLNMTKILVNFLTYSSLNLFYLTTPTRVTRNTKTLINNIYYNKPLNNIISGNLSSIIFDHLIQFLIEPLDFSGKSSKMINTQRCYKILTNSSLRLTFLELIGMVSALLLIQMLPLSIFSKL